MKIHQKHLIFLLTLAVYCSAYANWITATQLAKWTPRFYHSAVVFDNSLWIFNGYANGTTNDVLKDIWKSSDGANWTIVLDATPYPAHTHTQCVNFNGRIWIIGGEEGC